MPREFLLLEKVGVIVNGAVCLKGLSLTLEESSCWAIIGPSGSGKSLLGEVLKGRHFFSGRIETSFGMRGEFYKHVSLVEQRAQFSDLNNRRQFYYQQRYNASDAENSITAGEDLQRAEKGTVNKQGFFSKEKLLHFLELEKILEEPLIQLSSGELKKLQILKALIWNWKLLILDQPMTGLDSEMRGKVDRIFRELAIQGKNIILITNPNEIPAWITHIALLRKGELLAAGPAKEIMPLIAGVEFADLSNPAKLPYEGPGEDFSKAEQLVFLNKVNVSYGQKKVLHNISWEIKKGEKWSLSGPNGSGKSTLLSLICADHPQAYANEIILFGKRRGTGESIWDIKSKIGFLSAELHAYFDPGVTCFEAIASGFFDTIGLFRPLSEADHRLVLNWLELISLEPIRNKFLSSLSPGQQRLVLLARAMIKNPQLLILDEPCQGLDPSQARELRGLVDLYCETPGSSLIYVTHYREEVPSAVSHFLVLDGGKSIPNLLPKL
jgi:molybdate transport system ATP-binding protein